MRRDDVRIAREKLCFDLLELVRNDVVLLLCVDGLVD